MLIRSLKVVFAASLLLIVGGLFFVLAYRPEGQQTDIEPMRVIKSEITPEQARKDLLDELESMNNDSSSSNKDPEGRKRELLQELETLK